MTMVIEIEIKQKVTLLPLLESTASSPRNLNMIKRDKGYIKRMIRTSGGLVTGGTTCGLSLGVGQLWRFWR